MLYEVITITLGSLGGCCSMAWVAGLSGADTGVTFNDSVAVECTILLWITMSCPHHPFVPLSNSLPVYLLWI